MPLNLNEAKARLETLEQELITLVESVTAGSAPVQLDSSIGRLTRMDAIQQQKMAKANKARARVRLLQVRAALKRVGDKTYGLCLECEEDIAPKRLVVRPESPFCLECQAEAERA